MQGDAGEPLGRSGPRTRTLFWDSLEIPICSRYGDTLAGELVLGLNSRGPFLHPSVDTF